MRSRAVVAVALLALVASCGSRACPEPTLVADRAEPDPDAATDVLRAVERWRQAYEVRSADGLFELYGHGKDVMLVQQGTVIVGWEAIQAAIQERLAKAKELRLRLTDLRVALLAGGGGAVVVATAAREVADGVTTVADSGTVTLTFDRDGDRWVIVAEHFTVKPR